MRLRSSKTAPWNEAADCATTKPFVVMSLPAESNQRE